jgi:pseudouridine-5'-phosphate glycosidase
MPFPQNLETARAVEGIVRDAGAVPATVCVLSGVAHVGTADGDLARLAELGYSVRKTGTRDLPLLMSGLGTGDGATTVSATMWLAHRAGIQVFVTGGIGGVHRGVELTGDISADLTELARTPVAVVCAGAKSILDIPRTLEFLETYSVPVVGYGCTNLPAFFSRDSGFPAQMRLDTPGQVARLLHARSRLKMHAGTVIGVPIPDDAASDGFRVEEAIQQALLEAKSLPEMKGAAVTPFILKRVNELTAGASLSANIALVENNARVGAEIALALAELDSSSSPSAFASAAPFFNRASSFASSATTQPTHPSTTPPPHTSSRGPISGALQRAGSSADLFERAATVAQGHASEEGVGGGRGWGRGEKPVVVVGGACVDTQGVSLRGVVAGSSNPGVIRSAFGEVFAPSPKRDTNQPFR